MTKLPIVSRTLGILSKRTKKYVVQIHGNLVIYKLPQNHTYGQSDILSRFLFIQ